MQIFSYFQNTAVLSSFLILSLSDLFHFNFVLFRFSFLSTICIHFETVQLRNVRNTSPIRDKSRVCQVGVLLWDKPLRGWTIEYQTERKFSSIEKRKIPVIHLYHVFWKIHDSSRSRKIVALSQSQAHAQHLRHECIYCHYTRSKFRWPV